MPVEIWEVVFAIAVAASTWLLVKRISLKRKWVAVNFKQETIPDTIGIMLLLLLICYLIVDKVKQPDALLMYTSLVWFAGWLDDRTGTFYPKGIQGHIKHFLQTKKWTTGLSKIVLIVLAAAVGLYLGDWRGYGQAVLAFSVMILSPHVCNALDTRPLRVWKWTVGHILLFIWMGFPLDDTSSILYGTVVLLTWGYIEKRRKGMLGDSGAAVIGALLAWSLTHHAPLPMQLSLVLAYLAITIIAEKLSINGLLIKIRNVTAGG
ncbi:hypothetical protein [Bacillus piscicola]|uniref:hypothetical protein n=1 Tax=Bacillus piscicola TaxID=1632684 RepID=UPI001F090DBD|nr:hypothetical protein [Bacillus piscicola]